MRKAAAILTALILITSCASYTAEEGYSRIVIPETTGKPETRYRLIRKERAKAIIMKEMETKARVINVYPDDLSALEYPHVYTPAAEPVADEDGINTIQILLLPLGYDPMTEEDALRILGASSDLEPDFVILTGSVENQVMGAEMAGWNAVTMEGGTILYDLPLKVAGTGSSVFGVTDTKDVAIAPLSFDDSMPSSGAEAEAWALSLSESTDELEAVRAEAEAWALSLRGNPDELEAVRAETEAMTGERRILALSSAEPSGADWIEFTPFRYRSTMSFPVSEYLLSEGWLDAYRATHYTAETDGGITRHSGDLYERLDFIYSDGLLPVSAISYPVMGLTDRTGAFAVLAEMLVP